MTQRHGSLEYGQDSPTTRWFPLSSLCPICKKSYDSYENDIYLDAFDVPCFDWSLDLLLENLKPKNRGHSQVPGIYTENNQPTAQPTIKTKLHKFFATKNGAMFFEVDSKDVDKLENTGLVPFHASKKSMNLLDIP